jgi:hypothetical protein
MGLERALALEELDAICLVSGLLLVLQKKFLACW